MIFFHSSLFVLLQQEQQQIRFQLLCLMIEVFKHKWNLDLTCKGTGEMC